MSETKTGPALAASEWALSHQLVYNEHVGFKLSDGGLSVRMANGVPQHQVVSFTDVALPVAAICLQRAGPDGGPLFTREDVRALRSIGRWDADVPDSLERVDSIADRIEALLPPEE